MGCLGDKASQYASVLVSLSRGGGGGGAIGILVMKILIRDGEVGGFIHTDIRH